MISGIIYALKTKTPAESEDQALRSKVLKDKSISLALLVPALMLTMPVISFVLGNMIIGPSAALATIIVTSALGVAAIAASLFYAVKSKRKTLQIVMIAITVLALVAIGFESVQLFGAFQVFNN